MYPTRYVPNAVIRKAIRRKMIAAIVDQMVKKGEYHV